MLDLLRQELVLKASPIVVKVGTRILTDEKGHLNDAQVQSFASQIAAAHQSGRRLVLVSSGAVGSGIGRLGLHSRPTDLAQLQAVAAVGQSALIEAYNHHLEKHGLHAAQVLLTADDLDHRVKYLNIRNTLHALLNFNAIPILNENDALSVATLQTTFGDNDRLAALISNLINAPLLILLSDVDGLYNGDPKDPNSRVIPTVHQIDASIQALAFDRLTGLSKGGMASKLRVAHQIMTAGGSMILANGREPGVLGKILNGEERGTLFLPKENPITARKQWIGYAVIPHGAIQIDNGAVHVVEKLGRSLLPVGVLAVEGDFERGDVISILSEDGQEIARGLTNFSSNELQKIKGLHSDEIARLLPQRVYTEVINRDNLTITRIR